MLRIGEVSDWKKPKIDPSMVAPKHAVEFLSKLYNHVSKGTGAEEDERCFVSTTEDLSVVAWLSHCFVLPVVRIDVARCKRVWNTASVSKVFAEMNRFFENTAKKSQEFLLDSIIELEPASLYRPPIKSIRVAQFGNEGIFPNELNSASLTSISILGGTTQAINVKDAGGRQFVLKHGRGGCLPLTSLLVGSGSHCCAEFFTLRCYEASGASVPASALYRLRLVDESSGLDALTYAMLTEYVVGKPLNPQSISTDIFQRVKLTSWVDLALGNFDVCGVGYSNLIHCVDGEGEEKVYRVDGGCNVAFSANGTPQVPHNLDYSELEAFRQMASTRSTNVKSKAAVIGIKHVRSSISSGEARVQLLGSALSNRALTVSLCDVDLQALRKNLNAWMWDQHEVPALWVDMTDEFFARTMALRALVIEL